MTHTRRTRLLIVLAATAATLAMLEVVGRWGVPEAPPREDQLVADPVLGWMLPAGPQMDWRGTKARITSLGLRGKAPITAQGATRILFVGDSSVFGDGVRGSQTMSDQMAQRLVSRRLSDVQNGGVPGFTCQQSTDLIKRLADRFQPEILVSYNMHSDFRRASPDDRVMAEQQLGPLANTGLGRLISAGTLQLRIWRKRPIHEAPVYEACLTAMVAQQEASGGKTVLVIPFTESDFPESPRYGVPEPDAPGTRLVDYRAAMRRVAESSGSLLIDGPAIIGQSGLSKDAALQDMVHPTARGHSFLAEAITIALWPEDE
jgi:lysophospholipase L1-like esterase